MTKVTDNFTTMTRRIGKSGLVMGYISTLLENDRVKICKKCSAVFVLDIGEIWPEIKLCNGCQPKGIEQ
jgi:hypothetical protein